jgi:hypothetical protein
MAVTRREFLRATAAALGTLSLPQLLQDDPRMDGYSEATRQTRQTVKQYSDALKALVSYTIDGKSKAKVPEFVHKRVQDLLVNQLDMPKAHGWFKEMYEKGYGIHYSAIMLQDFRNSTAAEKLRDFYNGLADEGKVRLEQSLKREVGDDFIYDMMFKAGMRPMVFDPRLDPNNSVTTKDYTYNLPLRDGSGEVPVTEMVYTVRDEKGRVVFEGVNEFPAQIWGANQSDHYDLQRGIQFDMSYNQNLQPNFYLHRYKSNTIAGAGFPHPKEDPRDNRDTFGVKFYLGSKGREIYLFYSSRAYEGLTQPDGSPTHTDTKYQLSKVEIRKFRKFFMGVEMFDDRMNQ